MNIIYDLIKKKEINLNKINLKNLADKEIYFTGSFAYKKKIGKYFYTLRDNVGSKKLFYLAKNKKIYFSDSFVKLIKKHRNFNIFSVPKGCLSIIHQNGKVLRKNKFKVKLYKENQFKNKFLEKINFFLESLKKRYGDSCYVCLSGGLDSTIIVYLAQKIFKNPIAVTANFIYKNHKLKLSDDNKVANLVAKKLKIKIINLSFHYEEIPKHLNKILEYSQDWRDYNIHCATLNYFIAKELKKINSKIPTLTGDMMNEYCTDYKTEFFKKKKYYQIPKINKKILQRFLINGLDSSNREIGIFKNFGLELFQPYSILSDQYKNLPSKYFENNFKYKINGKILPKNIFKLVLKKKNRAQITDKSGGILGFFINNNFSQKFLLDRFTKKFNINKSWLNNFILAGQFNLNE
jgi:asparagine synthetase B (glutamine-hydrolysing)